MRKAITRLKKLVAVLTVIIVIFFMWFSWMSVVVSNTNVMESKIKTGLAAGIQAIERDAPRTKIVDGGGYYIPDVYSNVPSARYPGTPSQEVSAVLLETLNQDANALFCKVSGIGLDTDGRSEINAQATVTFNVLFGISKTIVVRESQSLTHFKNATGFEHY